MYFSLRILVHIAPDDFFRVIKTHLYIFVKNHALVEVEIFDQLQKLKSKIWYAKTEWGARGAEEPTI